MRPTVNDSEPKEFAPVLAGGHYRTAHIISSDPHLVCALNRVLYMNDYSCLFSCGADSAESNLRLLKADLIVVDYDMERDMAQTVLNHIRALHPDVPLLMTAARTLDNKERSALPVLPHLLLIKPLKTERLYSIIRALAQRSVAVKNYARSTPAQRCPDSGTCN